jgi:exodeoxyribonuclease-3
MPGPAMKITTWNVNGLRARLTHVVDFLREHRPDVLCLQETKVQDAQFPREIIEDEGYNVEPWGQKSYNGVALLARHRIEDVFRGLPGDPGDGERRVIGGVVGEFMVLNLYCPNGQEVGSVRYREKLEWFGRLRGLLDARYSTEEKVAVVGDFNVAPDDRDVHDPEAWRERILCSTPERQALREVMAFGLDDVLRKHHEQGGIYTWWHYRAGAAFKDQGLRIDLVLTTPPATEACTGVTVHKDLRVQRGASDHCPVTAEFR